MRFDGTVVAFIGGLAALLGLVIGVVPALHLKGINLSMVLRDSGRTGTASRQARYVRRGLAMAQVALAFVLLVGAGLLLASFRQLLGVNPGFQSTGILTGRVSPLVTQYPDDAGRALVRVARARRDSASARSRRRGHHHEHPVRLGRLEQRDHPGRTREGAR